MDQLQEHIFEPVNHKRHKKFTLFTLDTRQPLNAQARLDEFDLLTPIPPLSSHAIDA